MSMRPYATYKGERIRSLYNKRVIEAKQRYSLAATSAPRGGNTYDWKAWMRWRDGWLEELAATRDRLLDAAMAVERKKKSERKSERKALNVRRSRNIKRA
jgi:hypothetical protein